MRNISRKRDGRGRSAGSKATQFSSHNQPPPQSKLKQQTDPEAAALLHEAIYEKIPGVRNGKRIKVPFIEAFINSMRKNALAARVGEQIKYFKELTSLGVFDFEDYKKRLFRGVNNYYKKVLSSGRTLADGFDELVVAFRRSHMLYIFYFTAFVHARQHCSCGACDRGVDYAEFILPLLLKAPHSKDEDVPEESGDDDTPMGEPATQPPAEASSINETDADDEFYDGFGFD